MMDSHCRVHMHGLYMRLLSLLRIRECQNNLSHHSADLLLGWHDILMTYVKLPDFVHHIAVTLCHLSPLRVKGTERHLSTWQLKRGASINDAFERENISEFWSLWQNSHFRCLCKYVVAIVRVCVCVCAAHVLSRCTKQNEQYKKILVPTLLLSHSKFPLERERGKACSGL